MTCHRVTSDDRTSALGDGEATERTGRRTGRLRRPLALVASAAVVLMGTVAVPVLTGLGAPAAGAGTPTTVTQTFGFDNDTLQTFTVPANVTSLTVTLTGGQGGWGGTDSSGPPPAGGYQGQVTGTLDVTPGEILTIGVGSGADEPFTTACTPGQDASSPADSNKAVGGVNPLTAYDGGGGGAPGPNGCSGYGGAGGAATVVELGSTAGTPHDLGTIVAGGGGGDGGSGQYSLVRGQIGLAGYVAQTAPTSITYGMPAGCTTNCTSTSTIPDPSPLSSPATQGQQGTSVFTMCGGSTGSNSNQYFNANAPAGEAGCDGGGGAGGGGGTAGGGAGSVQFGSGSSDEWYGQGGSPGENSTGGFAGLAAQYSYYADTNTGRPTSSNTFQDPGATFDGSVVVTYSTGVPGAPTAVSGTAGDGSADLTWTAPGAGAAPISDYVVQYSSDGGSTWTTVDTGSTATSATVGGLTDGTGYVFEVQAVNDIGSGPFSASSPTITPSGPPGAPTVTSVTSTDGGLRIGFTAPASSAPITSYLYQLDGTGPWMTATGTTSPLTIGGLTDGTSYSVAIKAVNTIGTGPASNAMSGTPEAVPGAPTVTSIQTGAGSALIAFTPGGSGGGSLTGYRYSTDGGSTWTPTGTTSPLSLSGLTDGTTYAFELEAVNATGDGAPATASFTTPSTPGAPAVIAITPADGALQVTATAPASGGSPVTDVQWSTDGGATWASESAAGTPCVTTGATMTCAVDAQSVDGATPLVNGTGYPVEFRGVNAVGTGAASGAVTGTPSAVPGAPVLITGADGMVAADQALTVSFSPPSSDGGSPVTGYQYSTDAGATWHDRTDGAGATATTMTVTALSTDGSTALANGTTYDVEIRAVNADGAGPGSAVAVGIPVTVPSAPTLSALVPGNGTLAVALTPGSNGGSAVTGYEYSLDGGQTWTPAGTAAPTFSIGGLANGTAETVEVRADNAVGSSSPSSPLTATPATVPGPPTVTATSRGNGTISISWTPGSDGGSSVTGEEYSTDGGATWSAPGSVADPLVITTLSTDGSTPVANGTQYPVEIRAVNAVGVSAASAPVSVAPAGAPAAPGVALTPGNGSLAVQITPGDDGGSPVTGFDYSLDGGAFVSTGTTGTSFTITGLANGTSHTVVVRADNAIGTGTASAPVTGTPATVPDAPTTVLATSDSGSADVSWTAPAWNGGSPVTGYRATAYTSAAGTTAAGTPCTATAPTTACTITGLTNGTTYYVGVAALNAEGTGVSSSPLVAVTPVARPSAPTITSINSGDTYLSVVFTAGAAGGDPITSYQYSLDGGTTWTTATGTTSPLIISGLTDGTTYPVVLRAVSAAGLGATSNSKSATPAAYPSSVDPTTVVANGENAQVAVSWTVPANGGAPITQAQATAFNLVSGGNQMATCTTTTNLTPGDTAGCTITGLTNGTTYYVSIQSDNTTGWSARSAPRVPATPSITPGAVAAPAATGGDGQATVTWTPGSTGQSPITGYTVLCSTGGAYASCGSAGASATSATVTGLTNGTTYTFEIEATNSQGTGPASAASDPVTPAAPSVTSPVLPGGEVGLSYDVTPTASAGTGALTWSVTGGSLPGGLSLDPSTGEVSGTPTASGTSTFTLVATDGVGGTGTQDESVTVLAAPSVTSGPLPGGEVGVTYDRTPTATGGSGSFTWSVTGGSLPAGLTLDPATGEVTGTPTTAGPATFTLTATDGAGAGATQDESVTVIGGPSITSAPMPGGDVGVAYDQTPTATGGSGSFTWSVAAGILPDGLSLDPATGAVTGTPTTTGTSLFTVQATDGAGGTTTQVEAVTVADAPSITGPRLPGSAVGDPFSAGMTASGGTGSLTWSLSDGSLPPGLSLDPATGVVSGTPSRAGTFVFTLEVSDAVGGTATLATHIDTVPTLTVSSPVLPGGEVGVVYDVTPQAGNVTGTPTWSVSAGSLPDGLSLDPSTGTVSGTPTTPGTSTFTLQVADQSDSTATQDESVSVIDGPSVTSGPLPGGEVGVTYDQTPTATGGSGSLTWSVTGGSLPAGLTLDSATGEITGTPTTAGPTTFTLTATDGAGATATQDESVTVIDGPSVTSAPMPGGEVGVAYDQTPTATGGSGSFTWSVSAGSLPDGLSLDPSTGTVSGTPTTPGTSTFTLQVADQSGSTATQDESVTVAPALSLPTETLPTAEAGVAYDAVPSSSGGTGSVTWSVADGTLPPGLSLDPSTGTVSGVPTEPGEFTFTLRATDGVGGTGTTTLSVTVGDGPAPASTTIDGNVGAGLSHQLAVAGGTGPYSWAVTSGDLPPGLTLATDGLVTGVPTSAGTVTVTVTVTDQAGARGLGTVTIDVVPSALNSRTIATTPDGKGYWVATADGKVAAFGDAHSFGSVPATSLAAPVVGIAATADGKGYWLVASDGAVFAFGDAGADGSAAHLRLNQPIVGLVATPDGHGYWLVAADGGVFSYGTATFLGSAGGLHLNRPIVGMAATPDGRGYWLVAADGGVFSYGTAAFHGSEGGADLNRPVVGMAATPDGGGYWLVAADGGVFTFGDATYHGSTGGMRLNQPVDGIEATPDGHGYWLAAADGGVFTFGDAGFLGAHPAPLP